MVLKDSFLSQDESLKKCYNHSMEKQEVRTAYWIQKRVTDTSYVSGYKLLPEAECSNCHNIVNMQKPMCPYCRYTMVEQREKHLSD